MNILCSKESLLSGIQTVQRAVPSKSTLPILTGILLAAEGNNLKLRATDLEMGIECNVMVQVLAEGTVCLPARTLSELVRRLPDGDLELVTKPETRSVLIKYGRSEVTINGFEPEEFPVLPKVDGEPDYRLHQGILKNMIRRVVIAASQDETRPLFTGVLISAGEREIRMVATDTHRLAFCREPLEDERQAFQVIVPSKSLNELGRLLSDDEELVGMTINDSQVIFQTTNMIMFTRRLMGQFPNYRHVIPSGFKTRIKVPTKYFTGAIERAALFYKDGPSVIRLEARENNLELSSNTPEIGNLNEQLEVAIEGEDIQIAFNSKYILDALRIIETETTVMEFNGPLTAGVIRPDEDDDFLYLALPIRTV